MKIDGVSAIAVIVIASFGVDRIVTGMQFLLAYFPAYARRFPEPTLTMNSEEYVSATRQRKLVYFVLAALLSSFMVWRLEIRIFEAIGFKPTSAVAQQSQSEPQEEPGFFSKVAAIFPSAEGWRKFLDGLFTALILMGGADRVAALLKLPGGEKSESRPIEIKGRIVLEKEDDK